MALRRGQQEESVEKEMGFRLISKSAAQAQRFSYVFSHQWFQMGQICLWKSKANYYHVQESLTIHIRLLTQRNNLHT